MVLAASLRVPPVQRRLDGLDGLDDFETEGLRGRSEASIGCERGSTPTLDWFERRRHATVSAIYAGLA
jgi:hypothetical protein